MQYIVSSRGRPIGVTDLGLHRVDELSRAGWFHPNELGEQVMPRITAVHQALYAHAHRDPDQDRRPSAERALFGPTERGDLAEALHHAEALDLTLHREDGSLVPTEDIGIQDTEQLFVWLSDEEGWSDDLDDEAWDCLEELEDATDRESADAELLADHLADRFEPWTPYGEESTLPRFQILVRLLAADAIP